MRPCVWLILPIALCGCIGSAYDIQLEPGLLESGSDAHTYSIDTQFAASVAREISQRCNEVDFNHAVAVEYEQFFAQEMTRLEDEEPEVIGDYLRRANVGNMTIAEFRERGYPSGSVGLTFHGEGKLATSMEYLTRTAGSYAVFGDTLDCVDARREMSNLTRVGAMLKLTEDKS